MQLVVVWCQCTVGFVSAAGGIASAVASAQSSLGGEKVVYLLLLGWGLLREGMVGRSAEQRDKEDSYCCALRFDPGGPHSFYDNSFAAKKTAAGEAPTAAIVGGN